MRVHLIDGTYELFRAWFGAPAAKVDGREVGATRSLARQLLSIIRRERATHLAVAFDHVVESFRNDLFDGYKTGEGLEPELWQQFGPAEDAARALGLVVWPLVEFEADDGIAAGAWRYSQDERVTQVRMCTPDKDLAQSVVGDRIVRFDRFREAEMNEAGVIEKFGVQPASIPDWLALVGDDADGIPGVPGWGAKSSSVVLAEYKHIEDVPSNPAEWSVKVRGATRLSTNLEARRNDALLYRKLATLRTDVPLEESLDDLEWRGADHPRLLAFAESVGDKGLCDEVARLEAERGLG